MKVMWLSRVVQDQSENGEEDKGGGQSSSNLQAVCKIMHVS